MPHDCACRLMISRFVALSSTTSSRFPASWGWLPSNGARVGASASAAVNSMWKADPLPSSLSTHSLPPISSTRRFEIARPRPVPP